MSRRGAGLAPEADNPSPVIRRRKCRIGDTAKEYPHSVLLFEGAKTIALDATIVLPGYRTETPRFSSVMSDTLLNCVGGSRHAPGANGRRVVISHAAREGRGLNVIGLPALEVDDDLRAQIAGAIVVAGKPVMVNVAEPDAVMI
jgi:hypothetical protein